jgi:hypothetical protein
MGGQPGSEGEEAIEVRLDADEARIAFDGRSLALTGPDDENLTFRVEEELGPVERQLGFLRMIG